MADLGIATVRDAASSFAGTPGYAAPEQLAGRAEPRSDLLALGATLFALATGRRAFGSGGESLPDVSQVEDRLDELCAAADDRVPGSGDVVRGCLRREPSSRWPDAPAVAAVLQRVRSRQAAGSTLAELVAGRAAPAVPETPPPGAATVVLARGNVRSSGVDRFVGRAGVLGAVLGLVRGGERLVSIVGLGGMGKTRLAVEVAVRLQPELPGGAWFVDLTEATDLPGVALAVGRALGLPPGTTEPFERVAQGFSALGRALVVLDNLEQLTDVVRPLLTGWVNAAPHVSLVCTTRVALRAPGEKRVALQPLDPAECLALFRERVAEPVPAEHEPLLPELLRAADGMPLAVELLAARVGIVPVPKLLERLSDRLAVLGGGSPRARHRSLRTVLDGSYELLAPWARAALGALAAFEGGWTLEAAEAVLGPGDLPPEGWALDVLGELVDASLVRADPETGRFGMAVVVRQYVRQRLGDGERRRADARHVAFYARPSTLSVPASALVPELDNLVAAARRAIADGDGAAAARTAMRVAEVVGLTGPPAIAPPLLREAVRLAPVELAWAVRHRLATALRLAGALKESRVHLLELADEARRHGDAESRGKVLLSLGAVHADLGEVDLAIGCYDEALRVDPSDSLTRAIALGNRANARKRQARPVEAAEDYAAAIAAHRQAGDRHGEGLVLVNLGNLHVVQGRAAPALECYERAAALLRDAGDRRLEVLVVGNMGHVHSLLGRPDEAVRCLEQATLGHRAVGNGRDEGLVLCELGMVHAQEGRLAAARVCLESAHTLLEASADPQRLAHVRLQLGFHAVLEGRIADGRRWLADARTASARLHDPRFGALSLVLEAKLDRDRRALATLVDAVARFEAQGDDPMQAHAACALAELARALGDEGLHATAIARAEAAAERMGVGPMSPIRRELARARSTT